ncbi:unnamed protein product [Cochlearia groenlandica]
MTTIRDQREQIELLYGKCTRLTSSEENFEKKVDKIITTLYLFAKKLGRDKGKNTPDSPRDNDQRMNGLFKWNDTSILDDTQIEKDLSLWL